MLNKLKTMKQQYKYIKNTLINITESKRTKLRSKAIQTALYNIKQFNNYVNIDNITFNSKILP